MPNSVGRPPKYETPEEMQRIIDLYFIACAASKAKAEDDVGINQLDELPSEDREIVDSVEGYVPTVSGLAYILDMSTEALRNYEGKQEFLATVKRAKQRIEISLEQRLAGNAVTGSIFDLKHNFGWKDKSETEHSGVVGISDLTDEQLNAKLAALTESLSDD